MRYLWCIFNIAPLWSTPSKLCPEEPGHGQPNHDKIERYTFLYYVNKPKNIWGRILDDQLSFCSFMNEVEGDVSDSINACDDR